MIKSKKLLNLILKAAVFSATVVFPISSQIYTQPLAYRSTKVDDLKVDDLKKIRNNIKELRKDIYPDSPNYSLLKLNFKNTKDSSSANYMTNCMNSASLFMYLVTKELAKNDKFTNYIKNYQEKLEKLYKATDEEIEIESNLNKNEEDEVENPTIESNKNKNYTSKSIEDAIFEAIGGPYIFNGNKDITFSARQNNLPEEIKSILKEAEDKVANYLKEGKLTEDNLKNAKSFFIKRAQDDFQKTDDKDFYCKLTSLNDDQKIQYMKFIASQATSANGLKVFNNIEKISKKLLESSKEYMYNCINAYKDYIKKAKHRLKNEQDKGIKKILENDIKNNEEWMERNKNELNNCKETLNDSNKLEEYIKKLAATFKESKDIYAKIKKLEKNPADKQLKDQILKTFADQNKFAYDHKKKCKENEESHKKDLENTIEKIENVKYDEIKEIVKSIEVKTTELPSIMYPDYNDFIKPSILYLD